MSSVTQHTNTMLYKRPNPRPYRNAATQFVSSALPGGGVISRWTTGMAKPRIASGHPSVVGQIIDKMRQGCNPLAPKPAEWTPPLNPEFLAAHLEDPEAFLKKCEEWHARNTPPARREREPAALLDLAPVAALYEKWGVTAPPIADREKAWRLAGYSEVKIQKALAFHKKMDETSAARQEVLDLIFAKFPSANKPTPKAKTKKVIKVVKKKMGSSINE